MAGKTRRRPLSEEEQRVTLRIPVEVVQELDSFLDSSSPPLSRNVWIVEAIKTELERVKEEKSARYMRRIQKIEKHVA